MRKKLGLLLCMVIFCWSGTPSWADVYVVSAPAVVGTRIANLPYTITASGLYYLAGDLTSTGNGIIIEADNVTVDLMGFSLVGPGSTGIGINIQGHQNVELRNGTVRNFNGDGITSVLVGARSNGLMNMRVHHNGGRGIHIAGQFIQVQNCILSDNGSIGLSLTGYGCLVTSNTVCANGSMGISCTGDGHSLIGNVVTNNAGAGFNLSYVGPGPYRYLLDRNTAYNNTGGNLNGSPPGAAWGVNAGLP